LSPTVQATKSNYTQVHGGKATNYINFFLKKKFKILSKFKLAEQGTRYLTKKNYNCLIDSGNYKIKIKDNYKWIKKNELVQLSKRNNFLNMDTLSIISCSIKKIIEKKTILTFSEIIDKYSRFNKKNFIERKIISFKDLKKWTIHKYRIFDNQFKYFSIIGLKIITNCREISSWCQPIIKDHFKTFNGILICEKFGTMHYLLEVTLEPGFTKARFTSTVLIKNFNKIKKNNNERYFHFFKKRKGIVLNKKSSDEGGRFYKNEVHNVICLIKDYNIINKKNYLWISHNQINELIKKDMLTLEARNLFGYYNIEKLK
jgi:oxidase EvaA